MAAKRTATRTPLVSIRPGDGYVSQADVIDALDKGDLRRAIALLIPVLENVETTLATRIEALEDRTLNRTTH
jgi:hypothetical protein